MLQTTWKRKIALFWRGWGWSLVIAILIATSFRSAIADWNDVPTGSMKPTILEGDRIFVNKLAYDLKVPFTTWQLAKWDDPKRGDIVVFQSVDDPDTELIKRVVGLPGDRISVRSGRLFVNGERQREPFTNKRFPDRSFFAPTTVPKGHVFVMGDNRANSQDSRVFGPLPKENIEGEAFLRFWPLNRIGLLL